MNYTTTEPLFILTFESKMFFDSGDNSFIRCSAVCPISEAETFLNIRLQDVNQRDIQAKTERTNIIFDLIVPCLNQKPATIQDLGIIIYGSFSTNPKDKQTCYQMEAHWRTNVTRPRSPEDASVHLNEIIAACDNFRDLMGPSACRIVWDFNMNHEAFARYARDASFSLAEARDIDYLLKKTTDLSHRRNLSI